MLKELIQQEWVSYLEAERYSGLSHTTLWRYVGSGELKAARVGRSVRIHLPRAPPDEWVVNGYPLLHETTYLRASFE